MNKPGVESTKTGTVPFKQAVYRDLPASPVVAHPYFDTEEHDIEMDSRNFGRHKIHYRTYGSGPELLLLHGLMTTGYSWRYVIEPLGKHYTLYIPDLPGTGRSEVPAKGYYGAREVAEWISEFMRITGIYGCRTIGNSMAGYLCLRLALQYPDSMKKLINVHSPGKPQARFYALQAATFPPGVKQVLSVIVRRDPYQWAVKNVHYYNEGLKSLEEAKEYGNSIRSKEGAGSFIKYLTETLKPGPMTELKRLLEKRKQQGEKFPMPLLLLYATFDPLVPAQIGDYFHNLIPDAQLVRLPKASHFVHVDAPDEFCRQALKFFED